MRNHHKRAPCALGELFGGPSQETPSPPPACRRTDDDEGRITCGGEVCQNVDRIGQPQMPLDVTEAVRSDDLVEQVAAARDQTRGHLCGRDRVRRRKSDRWRQQRRSEQWRTADRVNEKQRGAEALCELNRDGHDTLVIVVRRTEQVDEPSPHPAAALKNENVSKSASATSVIGAGP